MTAMHTRRSFIGLAAASGALFVQGHEKSRKQEPETAATEELMREHGILRRGLIVYAETAPKLRSNADSVPPKALSDTAKLFRLVGEDHHEKILEENHVFPVVRKTKGPASAYVDVLQMQHERGRQITEYILAVTNSGKISSTNAVPLADALTAFVRMYTAHAAVEDTIVFPAWKATFSPAEFEEMTENFEEMERLQFGANEFEDARKIIASIETELGLSDLNTFTAALPPKVATTTRK
jgi:hemerythrin-like domain-containing protein